jgi:hypothetical protein
MIETQTSKHNRRFIATPYALLERLPGLQFAVVPEPSFSSPVRTPQVTA